MLDRELKLHALTMDYARKLLVDIPDEDFADQPAAGVNSPAWIVGHLAVVADMGARLLGGRMEFGDDWRMSFGPGSVPSPDRSSYPTKEELLGAFEKASSRLRSAAAVAEPDRLDAPQPTKFFKAELPTVGDFAAHILTTHQMLHLGQLSTWRRVKGLGSVLGI